MTKRDREDHPPFRERLRRWAFGTLTPKELAKRVWEEVNEDDIYSVAARLAYYFLFALFPLLLVLVTLIGFLPVENIFEEIMTYLHEVLPEEAMALIEQNIETIVREQRGGLLSFGLIFTLWFASRGVAAIAGALNLAYGVRESRPWWKVQGISLLLTLFLSIFAVLAAVLMIFGGQIGVWVAEIVGLGTLFEIGWEFARLFLAAAMMTFVLAVLYYFAPDVEQEWKWVTPGSVVAVLGWIVASLAFSYYVNNFGDYNRTYGTIGAVIILMTWMYIAAFMILLGGEINSIIERSRPEGKSIGEKRIAEKHPENLLLQARKRVPIQGRLRRWLTSPWSLLGGAAALSATVFFFLKRFRRSSEA